VLVSDEYNQWWHKISLLKLKKKIIRIEMYDRTDEDNIFTSFGNVGDEKGSPSWCDSMCEDLYPMCSYWAQAYLNDDYSLDERRFVRNLCCCKKVHDLKVIDCHDHEAILKKMNMMLWFR
jgi:hypothetical protein